MMINGKKVKIKKILINQDVSGKKRGWSVELYTNMRGKIKTSDEVIFANGSVYNVTHIFDSPRYFAIWIE